MEEVFVKKVSNIKKCSNLKSSSGITLVALIVTIIVLIILSGITFSLIIGKNGIISKAQEARKAQEIASIRENVLMDIQSEEIEILQNNEGISQTQIGKILEKYGTVNKNEYGAIESLTPMNKDYEIILEELYSGDIIPITIEQAKKTYVKKNTEVIDTLYNTIVIPNGFKVSRNSGENTDEGIVVEDKKGNEFVWIPVSLEEGETFEKKYPRTTFEGNEAIGNLDAAYIEPYVSGYDREKEEYEAMVASINSNKGFYVGRYEVGFKSETAKGGYTSFTSKPTQEQIEAETAKLVIQKDAQIYNYIPWGNKMDDITSANKGTQESPAYVIGAVELAQNFDKTNNYIGVTSTLIYGIQWDMIMRYVADEEHNVDDSSNWGNYSNYGIVTGDTSTESGILQTAGKNVNWQAKKIYDLAGNVYEWTNEVYASVSRIFRGGIYGGNGEIGSVVFRGSQYTDYADNQIGFRITLFIS